MNKLSKILSTFFKYILLISMFFIWIYYYQRNLLTSFLISFILSFVLDMILTIFLNKKNEINRLKENEKKLINDFSTQFLFSTNIENLNYFTNLFNNPNTKKFKNCFIIAQTTFIPYYKRTEIDENDIYEIYKTYNIKTKNLVLITKSFTEKAELLAKSISNYNFVLLNESDVYLKFLKPLNAKPPKVINFKETKKLKFKEILKLALNKKNAKNYFFSGFVILFSSLFIKFKIYYIVFAFILFLLCFFSYFNTWFKKEKNNDFI